MRRTRDFADYEDKNSINLEVSKKALLALEVDEFGLDQMDKDIILAFIEKYRGGPVGLSTIAASISEEPETIMDVVEPYLLQLGFLERTAQGSMAPRLAYEHLNLELPKDEQPRLFT